MELATRMLAHINNLGLSSMGHTREAAQWTLCVSISTGILQGFHQSAMVYTWHEISRESKSPVAGQNVYEWFITF